ncbi:MAG: hypothetical protein LBI84_06980 [Propionibacteriaceae bacterium]|nr:hypothetical protein [Propionibacteriaceae bacterium]
MNAAARGAERTLGSGLRPGVFRLRLLGSDSWQTSLRHMGRQGAEPPVVFIHGLGGASCLDALAADGDGHA